MPRPQLHSTFGEGIYPCQSHLHLYTVRQCGTHSATTRHPSCRPPHLALQVICPQLNLFYTDARITSYAITPVPVSLLPCLCYCESSNPGPQLHKCYETNQPRPSHFLPRVLLYRAASQPPAANSPLSGQPLLCRHALGLPPSTDHPPTNFTYKCDFKKPCNKLSDC